MKTPTELLNGVTHQYPNLWPKVEARLLSHAQYPKDEWPYWCFMPFNEWATILVDYYVDDIKKDPTLQERYLEDKIIHKMTVASTLGAWRYTQGVYVIAESIYHELIHTPIQGGTIPAQSLMHLPEWCLYIQVPHTTVTINDGVESKDLFGFWVSLDYAEFTHADGSRHVELRFLLNCSDQLLPMTLPLLPKSIEECVEAGYSGEDLLSRYGPDAGNATRRLNLFKEEIAEWMCHLLPIVLYICSQEPEIEDEHEPGAHPHYPKPKKTKKGFRLFPPKKPRIWTVGKQMGEQLRKAREAAGVPLHPGERTVSPHLRRAHWHGFWKGPRDGEREFYYKWLPPIFVQGNND